MIPDLIKISPHSPWDMLPAGIHTATLAEVKIRFAQTPHRKKLFDGFCLAVSNLQSAGCTKVYLDGSFVSAKVHPNDFDAAWEPTDVDPSKLDPVLLNFDNQRAAQKAKYEGEFFIANWPATTGGVNYLDFFQQDRDSGQKKGILSIPLGSLV
jgi:hypothetical protein